MSKEYDYCIIGAGPTGLTLAYLFSKIGKKCLWAKNGVFLNRKNLKLVAWIW